MTREGIAEEHLAKNIADAESYGSEVSAYSLQGADFIVTLVKEKFPCEVVLVWFHDTAKRELVLVRQTGGTTDQHLSRMSDKTGLAQAALRSQRAVVIPDAARDPRATEARWKAMGVEPKSIVVAPVMHAGKPSRTNASIV